MLFIIASPPGYRNLKSEKERTLEETKKNLDYYSRLIFDTSKLSSSVNKKVETLESKEARLVEERVNSLHVFEQWCMLQLRSERKNGGISKEIEALKRLKNHLENDLSTMDDKMVLN